MKLYLNLCDPAENLVQEVLRCATEDCDNPDLRSRGYIYWRMLSEDPNQAKMIITSERPQLADDGNLIDVQLRDKLIQEISMLASVYYKTPD